MTAQIEKVTVDSDMIEVEHFDPYISQSSLNGVPGSLQITISTSRVGLAVEESQIIDLAIQNCRSRFVSGFHIALLAVAPLSPVAH